MAGARLTELPGPLRCYVGCAVHLSGEPEDPFLIRLDPCRRGIKFFLMDGAQASFPTIQSSILVDLKRQDVFVKTENKRLIGKSRLCDSPSRAQVSRELKYARENDLGLDQILEDHPASATPDPKVREATGSARRR